MTAIIKIMFLVQIWGIQDAVFKNNGAPSPAVFQCKCINIKAGYPAKDQADD